MNNYNFRNLMKKNKFILTSIQTANENIKHNPHNNKKLIIQNPLNHSPKNFSLDSLLTFTSKFINNNSNYSNQLNYLNLKKNNNTPLSSKAKFLEKIEKPSKDWPGLIFLKKKGLSHVKPNFNFINYDFTAGAYFNKGGNFVTPKYNANKILINNIYKLLVYFFKSMYCIISKPVFIFTQDTIKIQLFYFACIGKNISLINKKGINLVGSEKRKKMGIGSTKKVSFNNFFSNLTKFYPNKFKFISRILSKFFNKKVEFDLIRLHKPYYNTQIFVNFLSLIINRKDTSKSINKIFASKSMNNSFLGIDSTYNFDLLEEFNYSKNSVHNQYKKEKDIRLANKWFGLSEFSSDSISKTSIVTPAYLTGMKININGRLRREPVIPKITTKLFEKGFTAKGRINYSEMARFTHKNRKGAFSITIKSGQNF